MKLISRTLKRSKLLIAVAAFVALALLVVGCSSGTKTGQTSSKTSGNLSGTIKIDGSSTVGPISEAVAEEFMTVNPSVKVIVGISGTGGGFKKFTSGETDISNASRPIEDAEKALAKKNGIEYIEIPVAYDGISIVVNKNNNWAKDITVNELKKIWEPNSQVKTWKDIRPEWPNEKLILYGPGTDSGTFDYFTSEINGQEKASRADYTASEDDNVLVQGIAGDKGALGYFGYAYYHENKDKLKILSVNGVKPTEDTIKNGSYKPLSRPIFIYINKKALKRPEVKEFIRFYLTDGVQLIPEIGYIPLNKSSYDKSLGLIR